jgi:hypothetical protein
MAEDCDNYIESNLKKNYRVWFSINPILKDKIKKKIDKENDPSQQYYNPQNSRLELWDWNNLIEKKSKQIMKLYTLKIQYWKIKLNKKRPKKFKNQNKKELGFSLCITMLLWWKAKHF